MSAPHVLADKFGDSPPQEKRQYNGGYEIDRVKEKKLVRKLDLYIVPVVMLLYLLSFLDR